MAEPEVGAGVLRLGERAFGPGEFAVMAIVNRTAWFLPFAGAYYRAKDRIR